MDNLQEIRTYAGTLGLIHTKNELETIVHGAETEESSYVAFLQNILSSEIRYRQDKAKDKRIKDAGFPYPKYLKDFDLSFCQSITKKQLNQLSELYFRDRLE